MKTLKKIVTGLPSDLSITSDHSSRHPGCFISLTGDHIKAGGLTGLSLPELQHFLTLGKYCPWWIRPRFGNCPADFQLLNEPSFFLLWQRDDGSYGLLLPLVDAGLRAVLVSNEQCPNTFSLRVEGGLASAPAPEQATLLYMGTGTDPYELCQSAISSIAQHFRTFRVRSEKTVPEFAEYLGWCTWDAFSETVDEKKFIKGLETWHKAKFPLKFVLLDDGWLDTHEGLLRGFDANSKFPSGLKALIARSKAKYDVKIFGVWHALHGWWWGVEPQSAAAQNVRLLVTSHPTPENSYKTGQRLALVHPEDISRFYLKWHQYLRRCGVDMIKVDNHNSMDLFGHGQVGSTATMTAYQQALQASAQTHFLGNLLHCMGNSNDVAYTMQSSLAWRNYEDHNVGWEAGHQYHICNNAMNNLWTSTFALPDWDIFQSHLGAGAYQAAARAISGGPIYVSDMPGKQDFALLRKLCTSNGRLLRCQAPALPARDRLFVNCAFTKKLMKITNRNDDIGVLGLFHCYWEGDAHKGDPKKQPPITDSFQPSDVPMLKGKQFALYYHQAGTLALSTRRQRHRVTLPWRAFEIVTIAPLTADIVCLGLLDKFNGSRAIERQGAQGQNTWFADLRDGGEIGFYCRKKPAQVKINGRKIKFLYDPASGLLRMRSNPGGPRQVLVIKKAK